jgi:hypothetical protein
MTGRCIAAKYTVAFFAAIALPVGTISIARGIFATADNVAGRRCAIKITASPFFAGTLFIAAVTMPRASGQSQRCTHNDKTEKGTYK